MSAFPNTATKAELIEAHREKMKSRKVHRYTRSVNVRGPWYWKLRKNTNSAGPRPTYLANRDYLKSIWPKGKTTNPGRSLNHGR